MTGASQADTAHIMDLADWPDCQCATVHVSFTSETKDPINEELLMKTQKSVTLINTAHSEVMHEAEMLEVLSMRPDPCFHSEVQPKDAEKVKARCRQSAMQANS